MVSFFPNNIPPATVRGNAMREPTLEHSGAATLEAQPPFATEAAAMPSLGMSGEPISILGAAPWPDAPWWQRINPSTLFVLLSSGIAIFFLAHELAIAGKLGFPTAESWVRAAYARNYFHGIVFQYLPGTPASVPTSPFWIVVLSLAFSIFHDPIIAGKLLGTIFLFLTGYYCFRLLRVLELDYGSSLLGGVLMITASALAWSELSGLESTLSTALIMGAFWWHFSHPGKVSMTLHFFVTGTILALGALTRPEIFLLYLIVATWLFFSNDPKRLRHVGMMKFGFVLIIAPVLITNYAVSGALVPTTFRSALGNDSIIRLAWHGNFGGMFAQLFVSLIGIWAMIRDVYLSTNPLWVLTIVLALWSRRRNKFHEHDATDSVFSLSVWILLVLPYLRALFLGVPDAFSDYGRLVHFISPIYTLAGVLSIRTIIRCELFRTISPKQMILGTAIALIVLGTAYILLLSPGNTSTITPSISCVLLVFFIVILLWAGMRQASIPLFKREQPNFVTEEERNKTEFAFHDDVHDPKLSAPMIAVLHAALVVLLAWNLATLPHAANDFAIAVHHVNHERTGNP
jgi:hypothetical protein